MNKKQLSERDKAELDNFINPEVRHPVIATTSKLLTTGVDAQTCKLIVIDQNLQSVAEFKQIIGRGTRLREDFGKLYFTIMDFRRVTELFARPDFDGDPVVIYEPKENESPVPPDDIDLPVDGVEELADGDMVIGDSPSTPGEGRRAKFVVDSVPVSVLAVEGKLVPQLREDDSVHLELNVPAKGKGRRITSENLHDEEWPHIIPNTWAWTRLRPICQQITDGEHLTPIRIKEQEVPLVTAKNVRDGFMDYEDTDWIAKETAVKTWSRCKPSKGDLLMVCVGATTGRLCVLRENRPMVLVRSVAVIRPGTMINVDYLALVLRSPMSQLQIWAKVKANAQPCLYINRIDSLPIPLPPLAEQRRIVAKVDELMAVFDALEVALIAARATAEKLLAATIARLGEPKTETAEVMDLHSSPEFIRAMLAAEIVDRMHSEPTLGQIKLQKVIYLAEYICQLTEIDSRPVRFQNGPHDPGLIEQVETKMKECEWFEAVPRSGGYGSEYCPLAKAGWHRNFFEQLWPKQAAAIRRLIDEMKTWRTERCERFATLYAAWNDLILWGKPITDAAILDEVLEHWHPDKVQIPKTKWIETLAWMKSEGCIPTGFGRATTSPRQAEWFQT